MTRKSLAEELGINSTRKTPLPPKFEPKVEVRVYDPRTKQFYEFKIAVPVEGYSGQAFQECQDRLQVLFEKMGLLKARPKPMEKTDATESEERPGAAAESESGPSA